MEDVKDTARHTYESTKNEVLGLGEELKHQGAELVGAARERAQGLAEQQVAFGAEQVGGVARAANKAADELQETSPQLARYVRDAASFADNFSTSLRERSVGDIMNDVTGYARREPVVFFGIAVAAGFALSRFLKSSAERSDRGYAGATGSSSGSSYGSSGSTYGNTYPRSGVGSNTPVASTYTTPSEYPTGRTSTTNPTGSTGTNYGGSSSAPAAGTTATGSTPSSTRTTFPSGVGSTADSSSTTPKRTGGPYT